MKMLFADIETRPTEAWVWGLFKQTVSISQIKSPGEMICWAAKWRGQKRVIYDGVNKSSKEDMVKHIWQLLDECDVFVHYNGKSFDRREINKMFLMQGLTPPSPYKQIDLLSVVKSNFRFASNKLDFISQQLGIGKKMPHEGFDLWKKCMDGNKKAWSIMRAYNIKDVELTEELYDRLLPWISNHPNHAQYEVKDAPCCPNCGSKDVQRRGYYHASLCTYARFVCKSCGKWSRSPVNETSPATRKEMLRNVN